MVLYSQSYSHTNGCQTLVPAYNHQEQSGVTHGHFDTQSGMAGTETAARLELQVTTKPWKRLDEGSGNVSFLPFFLPFVCFCCCCYCKFEPERTTHQTSRTKRCESQLPVNKRSPTLHQTEEPVMQLQCPSVEILFMLALQSIITATRLLKVTPP